MPDRFATPATSVSKNRESERNGKIALTVNLPRFAKIRLHLIKNHVQTSLITKIFRTFVDKITDSKKETIEHETPFLPKKKKYETKYH